MFVGYNLSMENLQRFAEIVRENATKVVHTRTEEYRYRLTCGAMKFLHGLAAIHDECIRCNKRGVFPTTELLADGERIFNLGCFLQEKIMDCAIINTATTPSVSYYMDNGNGFTIRFELVLNPDTPQFSNEEFFVRTETKGVREGLRIGNFEAIEPALEWVAAIV